VANHVRPLRVHEKLTDAGFIKDRFHGVLPGRCPAPAGNAGRRLARSHLPSVSVTTIAITIGGRGRVSGKRVVRISGTRTPEPREGHAVPPRRPSVLCIHL
jgi:hypothetical protein